MHERSICPSPGFHFYAHESCVTQGVAQVEEVVRKNLAQGADLDATYDPVLVTLHAQAHALWHTAVAGTA
jgi:hypothetical protein